MPAYLIVSTRDGKTDEERAEDWEEVKFRVPFIRDVCGYEVTVYRLGPGGARRKVAAPPHPYSQ